MADVSWRLWFSSSLASSMNVRFWVVASFVVSTSRFRPGSIYGRWPLPTPWVSTIIPFRSCTFGRPRPGHCVPSFIPPLCDICTGTPSICPPWDDMPYSLTRNYSHVPQLVSELDPPSCPSGLRRALGTPAMGTRSVITRNKEAGVSITINIESDTYSVVYGYSSSFSRYKRLCSMDASASILYTVGQLCDRHVSFM